MKQLGTKNFGYKITLKKWNNRTDLLAFANEKGEVIIQRLNWQKVITHPPPSDGVVVTALDWRTDEKILAVGYDTGLVNLINVETLQVGIALNNSASVKHLSFTQNTEKIHDDNEDERLKLLQSHTTYLPKLPNYSSLSSSPKRQDFDPMKQYNTQILNFLLIGCADGVIHIKAFGILGVGRIHIAKYIKRLPNDFVIVNVKMSDNFDYIYVWIKIDNLLKLLIFDSDIYRKYALSLLNLSVKYAFILNVMEYLEDVIQCMTEAWEKALIEMDNRLSKYAENQPEGTLSADLLELLIFGEASEQLSVFLTRDLTHKGLQKLGNFINVSYKTIQKLLVKPLHCGIVHIAYHLNDIKGMSSNSYYYRELLGNLSNEANVQTGALLIKSIELQQAIEQSTRDYQIFWRWLHDLIRNLTNHDPSDNEANISQQNVLYLTEFLYNFEYCKDEPLESDILSTSPPPPSASSQLRTTTVESTIDKDRFQHRGDAHEHKTGDDEDDDLEDDDDNMDKIEDTVDHDDHGNDGDLSRTNTTDAFANVSVSNATLGISTRTNVKKFNLERVGQYLQNRPLKIPIIKNDLQKEWNQLLNENLCLKQFKGMYPHNYKLSLIQQYKRLKREIRKTFINPNRSISKSIHLEYILDCMTLPVSNLPVDDIIITNVDTKTDNCINYVLLLQHKTLIYLELKQSNEMQWEKRIHFAKYQLQIKPIFSIDFQPYNLFYRYVQFYNDQFLSMLFDNSIIGGKQLPKHSHTHQQQLTQSCFMQLPISQLKSKLYTLAGKIKLTSNNKDEDDEQAHNKTIEKLEKQLKQQLEMLQVDKEDNADSLAAFNGNAHGDRRNKSRSTTPESDELYIKKLEIQIEIGKQKYLLTHPDNSPEHIENRQYCEKQKQLEYKRAVEILTISDRKKRLTLSRQQLLPYKYNTLLMHPVWNIYDIIEPTLLKNIDDFDAVYLAVSGARKVASILSKNHQRFRIYELDIEEEDDDDHDMVDASKDSNTLDTSKDGATDPSSLSSATE